MLRMKYREILNTIIFVEQIQYTESIIKEQGRIN
jgi:hypothetical protein